MKQDVYERSPRSRRARARSFGWIVTRLAWIAARLVSSNNETRYASAASCRAITADDWKRRSVYTDPSQHESPQTEQTTDLEVLRNFTDETLEGQLANEQLGRLLVTTNFTKGDRSRTESVRLLDTTSRLKVSSQQRDLQSTNVTHVGSGLAGSGLGCKLFTRGLAWVSLRTASSTRRLVDLPPVVLRAVCLVRAIVYLSDKMGDGR